MVNSNYAQAIEVLRGSAKECKEMAAKCGATRRRILRRRAKRLEQQAQLEQAENLQRIWRERAEQLEQAANILASFARAAALAHNMAERFFPDGR